MKRKSRALFFAILIFPLMAFFASCTWDGDGPLDVMPNGQSVVGKGYFMGAKLDSGKTIHLLSDTLYLSLSQIWSFSNCSLNSIDVDYNVQDTLVVVSPKVNIKVNTEDCPSPMYRPDTLLKLSLDGIPPEVTGIVVKNEADSLFASIKLRRGKLVRDTFSIFVDSAFASPSMLPLRTKKSPSFLRVLDSITPQKFHWRTLRAKCLMRVDMCEKVVADTIYPTNWYENDTALVPVRSACVSKDSTYCLDSKWEYDSTALGKVKTRLDTIWHMSTYYVEKIPKCAMVSSYAISTFTLGAKVNVVRDLFEPDESELSCGPATKKDWVAYRLESNSLVTADENEAPVDSLYKIWKSATVARDTVYVDSLAADSTESK